MAKRKKYLILGLIIVIFIAVNIALHIYGPREIVERIGLQNVYLATFLVASIGGLSSFTGAALFTSIATFAAGGANPLLLTLLGGLGIFISDSIFFQVVSHTKRFVPEHWDKRLRKLKSWVDQHPSRLVLLMIYAYTAFTPLPTDLLMIVLAASGYEYKKIALVLLASSFTVAALMAYFGEKIIELI